MMFITGLMPTSRETFVFHSQPSSSFHSSEMRASRMPLAAMRSMKSRYMERGVISNALNRPAFKRSGVRGIRSRINLTRAQGSSLSSRTHFFKCELEISSIASKPARSRVSATGSIMPVVMFSAQRL